MDTGPRCRGTHGRGISREAGLQEVIPFLSSFDCATIDTNSTPTRSETVMPSTGNAFGIIVTVAVSTAAGSYLLYQSAPSMAEGTWNKRKERTLERAREYATTLHVADESRKAAERLLDAIENALSLAIFESIGVASRPNKAIFEAWIANFQPNNLETSLKQLDTALDKLAVKVDGVLILATMEDGSGNVQICQKLKQRKSLLSQQLVLTMERTDALWVSYYRFFRILKAEETRLAHEAQLYKEILDGADESRKSQEGLLDEIEGALMRARFDSDYEAKTAK
jgi:hypothetical protein